MRSIIPERYGQRVVAPPISTPELRALVVSNMLPDAAHPERGRFVRDQVQALRRLEGLDVELYEFAPGAAALVAAARELRGRGRAQRQRGEARLDVVHAHFGLSAWPALAVRARVRALTVHGTDVSHPRTRQATRCVLPLMDIVAAASAPLAAELPGRAARRRAMVLPCGVDMERFRPLPRMQARAELGLDPEGPYLLFPADPARAGKRFDRARALAGKTSLSAETSRATGRERTGETTLLTLGGVSPEQVPLWINAANAVVVPSEQEGFGLAVLEALACDVPVAATPVGVHPQALEGVQGALCAPFDLLSWRAAVEPHLAAADPRVQGRSHAERFSAERMAQRVAAAWRALPL
jgi:teichuronic acid biosynthesis glycosyltransferase TuaC